VTLDGLCERICVVGGANSVGGGRKNNISTAPPLRTSPQFKVVEHTKKKVGDMNKTRLPNIESSPD
jgi:hypothetical protein